MSDPAFYRTRMGQRFYERTMPTLVEQLERLNARLDGIEVLKAAGTAPDPKVDELLLATYGLVNAVDEVFRTEIVSGSEATRRAFQNLRARAKIARRAANDIH